MTDIHIKTAYEIFKSIEKKHSTSSLALAGSVGKGTHNIKSDIDILVVDEIFHENYQIKYSKNECLINVLLLSPMYFADFEPIRYLRFDFQHFDYILSSKIICDPNNYIGDLRKNVLSIRKQIESDKKYYLKILYEEINNLLLQIERTSGKYHLFQNECKLAVLICSYWFLWNGIIFHDKYTTQNAFKVIEEKDNSLYQLISALVKNIPDKILVIDSLLNYFENNYSVWHS